MVKSLKSRIPMRISACKSGRCASPLQCQCVLTRCRFCKQSEEHDPSEDFEEYLQCEFCGDGGKVQPPMCRTETKIKLWQRSNSGVEC